MTNIYLLLLLLFFAATSPLHAEVFVISAGSNVSADSRAKVLEYATSDAESFASTMEKVGGVSANSVLLKKNPKINEFERALALTAEKLKASAKAATSKFVFFFSGHADERGLHFIDGFYSKNRLDAYLKMLPVKTKILIIDSCFAGVLSSKGIKSSPGFGSPKMNFDEPSGSIYLTASSSSELAFESKRFRGGLFSRNIIDGLNGGADSNSDGVVTATELYEFAFRETQLSSRLLPVPSVQNPEFVSNLSGRGSVALSFPSTMRGDVRLTADLSGTLKLYSAKGVGSFDHVKNSGIVDTIKLPAGDYRIQIQRGTRSGTGDVHVAGDKVALLTSDDIAWNQPLDSNAAISRGIDIKKTQQEDAKGEVSIDGAIGILGENAADVSVGFGRLNKDGFLGPRLSAELTQSWSRPKNTRSGPTDSPPDNEYYDSQYPEKRDISWDAGVLLGLGVPLIYESANQNQLHLMGAFGPKAVTVYKTHGSDGHSESTGVFLAARLELRDTLPGSRNFFGFGFEKIFMGGVESRKGSSEIGSIFLKFGRLNYL